MVSIRWPSNPGIRSTEDTAFILCVDGWDPHIHKVWGLVLYGIIRKVHPTAQVEFPAGTVGEFVTNYLAENRYIIQIIGQLFINDSIQFLGVPAQAWLHGFIFLCNLQSPSDATVLGSGNYSNQYCGGSMFNSNSFTNVDWGVSVNAGPSNSPWIHVNLRTAAHRMRNNFLCLGHQEHLCCPSDQHNPWDYTKFHCWDDDR